MGIRYGNVYVIAEISALFQFNVCGRELQKVAAAYSQE
jgi:hypothetical protein